MSVRLFAQQCPQNTWPQCRQWCLRTTTEKSVLQHLHQNTALSLTQRGPFSLCFGCWNFFSGLPDVCEGRVSRRGAGEEAARAHEPAPHGGHRAARCRCTAIHLRHPPARPHPQPPPPGPRRRRGRGRSGRGCTTCAAAGSGGGAPTTRSYCARPRRAHTCGTARGGPCREAWHSPWSSSVGREVVGVRLVIIVRFFFPRRRGRKGGGGRGHGRDGSDAARAARRVVVPETGAVTGVRSDAPAA